MKTEVLSVNFKKDDAWEELEDNLEEYGRAGLDKELKDSTVIEVKGEKIGLIGTSPIDMFERTTHPNYHKDCTVESLEETIEDVQEEIDEFKQKGINKIFLLSHLGYKRDKILAEKTSGIDVIIGGHTHELIKDIKEGENLVYTKDNEPLIITQAGKDGAYFGELNLTFDKNGIITKAQNNIGETRLFHKNLVNQHIFDNILGKPEQIGYIAEAPAPPTSLIEENPHANFVCDAMKIQMNADVAIWNNSGVRNFFRKGNVDSRDIKDIAPFYDKMCSANVSEKAIVDLFKLTLKKAYSSPGNKPGVIAVSGLEYSLNNKTGDLLSMSFVDRNGKKEVIDINNPKEDKFYKLATDEFVMSAGADFPILAKAEDCIEILDYDKDVLTCEYIKNLNRPIIINQTGRIHFVD